MRDDNEIQMKTFLPVPSDLETKIRRKNPDGTFGKRIGLSFER